MREINEFIKERKQLRDRLNDDEITLFNRSSQRLGVFPISLLNIDIENSLNQTYFNNLDQIIYRGVGLNKITLSSNSRDLLSTLCMFRNEREKFTMENLYAKYIGCYIEEIMFTNDTTNEYQIKIIADTIAIN